MPEPFERMATMSTRLVRAAFVPWPPPAHIGVPAVAELHTSVPPDPLSVTYVSSVWLMGDGKSLGNCADIWRMVEDEWRLE